jgi:outer membrane usher protein FimD/PapC
VKGSDSVDLSIGLDETGTGSLGLYGEGLVGRGVDRVLGFSATGRSPEATISAAGRYSRIAAQGSADFSGKLGFSSTLALAEGVLAATSSPGEAYAILLPAAELKGTRVELRSSDGLPSSSDSGRASIVSGLTPYKDYVAEIEMPLSPPETRPHPSSVELSPAYRSVSVIRVGAEPSISARGLLLDNSGRPVPNMAGDVVDSSGAAAPFSGTFTDERGIFECYGLSPGPTLIRWENGWLSSFMIPPSPPGSIIELAPVSSAMPETGGGKP